MTNELDWVMATPAVEVFIRGGTLPLSNRMLIATGKNLA